YRAERERIRQQHAQRREGDQAARRHDALAQPADLGEHQHRARPHRRRRQAEQPEIGTEQEDGRGEARTRRETKLAEQQREPGGEKPDVQTRNRQEMRQPRADVALANIGVEDRVGREHQRVHDRRPRPEQFRAPAREPVAPRSRPAAAPHSAPATPMIPTAAPSGARRASQRAVTSTGATAYSAPRTANKSRPANSPAPNAIVRKRIGGRISRRAASAGYISCTGRAPQRGASPTLRNPSSRATSSLA